jgi:hypothetical protein
MAMVIVFDIYLVHTAYTTKVNILDFIAGYLDSVIHAISDGLLNFVMSILYCVYYAIMGVVGFVIYAAKGLVSFIWWAGKGLLIIAFLLINYGMICDFGAILIGYFVGKLKTQ